MRAQEEASARAVPITLPAARPVDDTPLAHVSPPPCARSQRSHKPRGQKKTALPCIGGAASGRASASNTAIQRREPAEHGSMQIDCELPRHKSNDWRKRTKPRNEAEAPHRRQRSEEHTSELQSLRQ